MDLSHLEVSEHQTLASFLAKIVGEVELFSYAYEWLGGEQCFKLTCELRFKNTRSHDTHIFVMIVSCNMFSS